MMALGKDWKNLYLESNTNLYNFLFTFSYLFDIELILTRFISHYKKRKTNKY
jgi:hypothetical protein